MLASEDVFGFLTKLLRSILAKNSFEEFSQCGHLYFSANNQKRKSWNVVIQEKGVRSSCDVLTKAQLICPFGLFFCWTGFISSSLSSVTVPNTTGSFQSRITRRFPQDDVTITLSLQFPWEQRRRAEACDAAPVPVIALREFCGM